MIFKKNKRGNIYFNIGLGIFLLIAGVLFLPFLTDDIETTRTDLQCDSPSSISDGTKMICLGISGLAPYFIWFFLMVGIGFIIGGNR